MIFMGVLYSVLTPLKDVVPKMKIFGSGGKDPLNSLSHFWEREESFWPVFVFIIT